MLQTSHQMIFFFLQEKLSVNLSIIGVTKSKTSPMIYHLTIINKLVHILQLIIKMSRVLHSMVLVICLILIFPGFLGQLTGPCIIGGNQIQFIQTHWKLELNQYLVINTRTFLPHSLCRRRSRIIKDYQYHFNVMVCRRFVLIMNKR